MTAAANNIALFTGADSGFLPLLDDLLSSLSSPGSQSGRVPGEFYVLDLGLQGDEVAQIKSRHPWVKLVSIPYQEHPQMIQAFLYKTMLNQFVPDKEIYVWVDADIWFQDPGVLEDLVQMVPSHEIAIVEESHPSYGHQQIIDKWLSDTYGAMFKPEVAEALAKLPPLNAGLFAIKGSSNLLTRWQGLLLGLLKKMPTGMVSDQGMLNYLIRGESVPAHILPATNNWMVHRSQPIWDTDLEALCPPDDIGQPIRALHLTADAKDKICDAMRDGEVVQTTFRYADVRRNLGG